MMTQFKSFVIIFILISSATYAQPSSLDSLRGVVSHTENLTEKYDALLQLYELAKNNDPETAEIYLHKAIETAVQDKNVFNQGNAHNKLGLFYGGNYDFEKGMHHFNIAKDLFLEIGDQEMEGVVYNNIGLNFGYQQEFGKELTYHHKALDLFTALNKEYRQAMSYVNIGNVYIQKNDYDKSISYYEKALPIYEKNDDYKRLGTCLNNIALIYFNQNKDELSFKYFSKTLKVYEIIDNKRGMSMVLYNMASPLLRMKKYDDALNHLKRAEGILLKIGSEEGLAICYNNFGTLYAELNKYAEAERYYNLAVIGARKTKQKQLELSCYKGLSELFYKTKNFEGAYLNYKMYSEITDSIKNAQIEEINEVEKEHLAEKNKKELELINKEKEMESYQSKVTIFATIAIIFVLFILLFGLYKKYQNKNKLNHLLTEKNELIEEKNKEITDSISYAKRIQNAILPPDKLLKKHLNNAFVLYKPKDIVAGDFYWMEQKANKILFAVADCTGHGVPGAMVSVICNNGLNRSVREFGLTKPGEILDKTRELVIQEFEKSEEEVKDGMDIALCTISENQLEYAGAHNPLWIIRSGELIEIKADKQPIGKFEGMLPYTSHSVELLKEDVIYIFSDGFIDQFGGEKGKKYKTSNFKELLLSLDLDNMESQKAVLDKTFKDWKGDLDQLDDVCVMGVKI